MELAGESIFVGTLFHQFSRGKESSTFEYSAEYLNHPSAFTISPELELYSGPQPGIGPLPAAFTDCAPDRWGRNLIAKAIRENEPLRRLTELDYLLGVGDDSRIGALRFEENSFELGAEGKAIPPLIELPRLLAASRLVADSELNAIKQLLGAGSASLGGARPKAQVLDGEDLWIAKFPHNSDSWDVMAMEKLALDLADSIGIAVPQTRLVSVDGQSVLLTKRFDRVSSLRVGYQSLMTALLKTDGEQADYLEVAELLSIVSEQVTSDLQELFKRIALSIAIRNTDDHLRNHGLLRTGHGWRLSPVFDINPNPISETSLRATSIAGAIGPEAEFAALVEHSEYFDLSRSEAKVTLLAVSDALGNAPKIAASLGINKQALGPFSQVFAQSQQLIAGV